MYYCFCYKYFKSLLMIWKLQNKIHLNKKYLELGIDYIKNLLHVC
jgi:hypothetical protein